MASSLNDCSLEPQKILVVERDRCVVAVLDRSELTRCRARLGVGRTAARNCRGRRELRRPRKGCRSKPRMRWSTWRWT